MKKIVLLAFLFLSFGTVHSQDKLIKVSPFHFFDGTFNMSLEKSCEKSGYTINLSGGLHLVEESLYDMNNGNEEGATAEVQLRKYVLNFKNSESKLSGVYVAPYAKLSYFHMEDNYTDWYYEYDDAGNYIDWSEESYVNASSKSGQAGVVMGVQYIMSDVLVFDFLLGGGVQYAVEAGNRNTDRYDGSFARFYTGVMPKIGFNFGVKL